MICWPPGIRLFEEDGFFEQPQVADFEETKIGARPTETEVTASRALSHALDGESRRGPLDRWQCRDTTPRGAATTLRSCRGRRGRESPICSQ